MSHGRREQDRRLPGGMLRIVLHGVADELRKAFRFYDWDASKNEVRWMCSFDTTEDDVDAFVAELARLT